MKHVRDRKLRILVTGVGGPAGINTARLLQSIRNVEVYGVDSSDLAAGKAFVDTFAIVAPVSKKSVYMREMRACITRWNIDIVVPTVAEELIVIHAVCKDMPVQLIASPHKTLALCHDKGMLYTYVDAHLPGALPRWQYLDQPLRFKAEQYFLKPTIGRGGRGCRVVYREEISVLKKVLPKPHEWLLMEILPGTEWTVDAYVTRDGDVPLLVPRERIALTGGISLKGKTIHNRVVDEKTRHVS